MKIATMALRHTSHIYTNSNEPQQALSNKQLSRPIADPSDVQLFTYSDHLNKALWYFIIISAHKPQWN